MPRQKNIFVPYRALGFVSNYVPLSLRYINRRNENLVVTCAERSFHTYSCSKLNLLSVSPQHPGCITCLTSDSYLVFTACENVIYAWRRGTELKHTYKGPAKNVSQLLTFGPHLIAVYGSDVIVIWDIKNEVIVREITFKKFSITLIIHPSAYIDKILIGSGEGSLQLWNIKSNKLIYTFPGWESPVTALEQAPALDVVGIGLDNGNIFVHNLKFDKTIVQFHQDWKEVTALSFRTDGSPIMASASAKGHIAIWDLEKRRLHSEIREAHNDYISGLKFLPNEPLLISNSADNSIKMWIFDLPDDGGRLLRLRDGHSSPPLKIEFYGTKGKNILSAGSDSTLRSFSTEVDSMNKNLGHASYNRKVAKKKGIKYDPGKMEPIIDFDSGVTREKDWDNIVAVHRFTPIVTTWSYDKCRMGEHKLIHDRFKGVFPVAALCTSISSCGNFAVVGYNTGHLDKFNIQSGIFRGSYCKDGKATAHDGEIRGVALDGMNTLIISGGSDKNLIFWKFKDQSHVKTINFKSGVSKLTIHRESSMLAVALDNFMIAIVDLESMKVVRTFQDHDVHNTHLHNISDMTFSPDSRWLVVATTDCSIMTWDLPTGRLIDWIVLPSICTSLSMSPTGEYLATCHSGSVGVFLWVNTVLYSNVSICPLPDSYNPELVELPVSGVFSIDTGSENEDEEMSVDAQEFLSPEQIDKLATLSLSSQSHWLNLLDLDVIKLRNKPKEPVKVPKNAPFFLPVVSGLKPTFLIEEAKDWKKEGDKSKVLQVMQHGSEFFQLLESCVDSEKYEAVVEKLKTFPPSKIDVEIRCLSPENGGSIHLMECFLKALVFNMKTNKNFEILHSYLALFLQVHKELIASEDSLIPFLEELNSMKSWERLQEKMNFCKCAGNYFRSAVL